jgi:hypothetical protein
MPTGRWSCTSNKNLTAESAEGADTSKFPLTLALSRGGIVRETGPVAPTHEAILIPSG